MLAPAAPCYNPRVFWTFLLSGLALLSAGLLLWQYLVARRFPLHVRAGHGQPRPGVTVLKPLKGCDAETERCLRSWFNQDYGGPVQILLGVASPADPACEVVRRLLAEFPARDAQLAVCGETLGANAKVSTLIQLERLTKHEVTVVSDADVWAPFDLLTEVVAALADERVGLVNCFYQLANPTTAAMRWEAIMVNADFWSQVLQSRSLRPMDFALGAVMAVRRGALREIGGFVALADYLADDYQLGHLVAGAGWRIELCPVVVECRESPRGWREVWSHQLRWARTIRVCQPVPYFFSILSNPTLWPLLWLAAAPRLEVLAAVVTLLLGRIVAALDLQERLTRSREHEANGWLVPLRDLFGAVIWALAFVGNEITWRGRRYRIQPGGKLENRRDESAR